MRNAGSRLQRAKSFKSFLERAFDNCESSLDSQSLDRQLEVWKQGYQFYCLEDDRQKNKQKETLVKEQLLDSQILTTEERIEVLERDIEMFKLLNY